MHHVYSVSYCKVWLIGVSKGRATWPTELMDHTILIESVKHSLSIWDSVKGTKRCFCFLLDPSKEGVWYRRYTCVSCPSCLELDFLNCTDKSIGEWKFKNFEIQAAIIYELFDPVFGVAQMNQWEGKSSDAKAEWKKKSQTIKKLIVSSVYQ